MTQSCDRSHPLPHRGTPGGVTSRRPLTIDGFTLVELLIVVAVIAVIAAIAVPNLLRARQSSNESAAIGSVRTVISGETAFASSCGGGGYAQSNADLAKGPVGGAPFIPPDLAQADVAATAKSGYIVDVNNSAQAGNRNVLAANKACNASAAASRSMFHVVADPVVRGQTGTRSFGSDQRGTIYYRTTAAVQNPIPAALTTFVQ